MSIESLRMPRTISSAQTFLMKFIFPFVWISGFAVTTAFLFVGGQETDVGPMKWMFLAVTLAGSAFLYSGCMRLKRVVVDGNTLMISNYFSTIAVPLADVEDVRENRWLNINPVTLFFRRPTDFGSSVVFMPKVRWFGGLFSSHPVVDEIRTAAGLKTR